MLKTGNGKELEKSRPGRRRCRVQCSAVRWQNQELFWGVRGAGQNFGGATQIEYRLRALTEVYGGPLFYPLSAEVMRTPP